VGLQRGRSVRNVSGRGSVMPDNYLWELLQTAARVVELDQLESEIRGTRDWKAGKDEWEAQKQHFNKLRAEYVDVLLGDDAARKDVADEVQGQLTSFRDEADPSWYPALEYTQDNLMPYLTKEAGRSPRMRKARKAAPFAVAALIAAIYFGTAIFSETPVTQAIETREGIRQRAAAAEKVIRYDDWMDTRVRRGGWVKGFLLWPIEPGPAEIRGAGEFVGLVLASQQYAKGCGSVLVRVAALPTSKSKWSAMSRTTSSARIFSGKFLHR
jgi:hypothetical protein